MIKLLTSDGKRLKTSDSKYTKALPPENMILTVNEASIIRSNIPSDFAGLCVGSGTTNCYEFVTLAEANPSIIQLYKTLGQSNIRVECGDFRPWYPDTAYTVYPPELPYYYNKSFVDRMCAIFDSAGWSITWLLNLRQYYTYGVSMFADMAGYIYSVMGSRLKGVEIGNEPDRYTLNSGRDTSWTYSDFLTEWDAYETAIHAIDPDIPLCATQTGSTDWIHDFSVDRGSKIEFLNQHKYPVTVNGTGKLAATIENILSPGLHDDTYSDLLIAPAYANSAGLPITMGETNCVSGSKDGVSNVFAASLWGIDYLFMCLRAGYARVNFHGSFETTTYYAPILMDGTPGPLYYSELLFHYAAPSGSLVSATLLNLSTVNAVGYSVLRSDGSLAVVIDNKSLVADANVKISFQGNYTQATVVYMTAPSFTSKTGITFGGASVASDGTWSVSTSKKVEISGKNAWVKVPVLNAAVVVFS